MPEKLLTLKEAANLLGISEHEAEKLVKKGDLPAYQIGGKFLRFRKDQIEATRGWLADESRKAPQEVYIENHDVAYPESRIDTILDFLYFYDFYIISTAVIFVILWFIFMT